jgi:AcrR family transcriptional regulator
VTDQFIRSTPRGSRRKAQLLVASARLFEQFGYHNVSMDDIAAAVGITGPALYRHFPNKHDVLVQALDEQVSSIERVAERVLAEHADGEARFEAFLDALASLVVDVHDALLWKRERAHLNAAEEHAVQLRLRHVTDQTKQVIRGRRPDLSEHDARLLSWVLQAIYFDTRGYRSGLERAELVEVLALMARGVAAADLAAAPACALPTRPSSALTPVGRRERVLDAATQLFATQGYRAVSVEDIAEASQTAIATVYQLVSGKANLLHAILARGSEGTYFLTAHRLAFAADHVTRLDAIVDVYIELACGPHGRLLKVLAADFVYLDEDARRALRRSQREYVEEWVRALSELRPELTNTQVRARVHTAIGVISETVQIANLRNRPNLAGELRLLAITILHS